MEISKVRRIRKSEGRRRLLGQLMLEHPQYQYFWEIPYPFAKIELEEAIEREGVNPDLHLAIEVVILEQIANGDPAETGKATV
jgi:hypothetical protein